MMAECDTILKERQRGRLKLNTEDSPTLALILVIARHVKYSEFNLLQMAADVEMPEGLFAQKTVLYHEAQMKITQVLQYWLNSTVGLTVKDVLDQVKKWTTQDVIDRAVWKSLDAQEIVDFTPGDAQLNSGPASLDDKRLKQLQQWTKESLSEKPFCTVKCRIWTETPAGIPLKDIFSKLKWVSRHSRTFGLVHDDLADVTTLLSERHLGYRGSVRILVTGKGGVGKTTAMKQLGLSWVNRTANELKKFDFVFHVNLKDIKKNAKLEEIIVYQHKGLNCNGVHPAEVKEILQEKRNNMVLLLFDGYDEYHYGANSDIDKAMRKSYLRNCWVIVTSRETTQLSKIRDYLDAEAKIVGFDGPQVKEYIGRYLGDDRKCRDFTEIARRRGVIRRSSSWPFGHIDYGILCIPILLHMVCYLYISKLSLPNSIAGILSAIVDRWINWDQIRATGHKTCKDVRNTLVRLGRLAMRGLTQKPPQQTFTKNEVTQRVGEEALELGLLFGTDPDPTQEEESHTYSFFHLLLQEFTAANYVATLDKKKLYFLFPSADSILRHREVIVLACELVECPDILFSLIYDRLSPGHGAPAPDTSHVRTFVEYIWNEVPGARGNVHIQQLRRLSMPKLIRVRSC